MVVETKAIRRKSVERVISLFMEIEEGNCGNLNLKALTASGTELPRSCVGNMLTCLSSSCLQYSLNRGLSIRTRQHITWGNE